MAIYVFIHDHLDMLGVPGVHPGVVDKECVCKGTRGTGLGLVHEAPVELPRYEV